MYIGDRDFKQKNTLSVLWSYQKGNPDAILAFAGSALYLAYIYSDLDGKYDQAAQTYQVAVQALNAHEYKNWLYLGFINDGLALMNQRLARLDTAIHYSKLAIEIIEGELGPKNENYSKALNNLGLIYHKMADYEKARGAFNRALESLSELGEEADYLRANYYNNLGMTFEGQLRPEEAEGYYKKALHIRQAGSIMNKLDIASSLSNFGDLASLKADADTAKALYQQALQLYKEEKHYQAGLLLNKLGKLSLQQKAFEDAESELLQALKIYNITFQGSPHTDLADTYTNLGNLARERKDYPLAEHYYSTSLAMHKQLLGLQHPIVSASYESMGEVRGGPRFMGLGYAVF